MKEEFEEGELVEVRDDDDQEWVKAVFVQKVVDVSYWARMPDSPAAGYQQIRKFQPETEPLFISRQGVFLTAQEAVMQLQERIEKILEELKELKTQIK